MHPFAEVELFYRDLAEVHLLLDFMSGRSDKSLSELKDICGYNAPLEDPRPLSPREVVERICSITYPPSGGIEANAAQAAFILIVKDKLNSLAFPAKGLTIAFTSMFAGVALEQRKLFQRPTELQAPDAGGGTPPLGKPENRTLQPEPGGRGAYFSAKAAYPNLERQARRFRVLYDVLPIVAIGIVAFIVWLNWDIAVTSNILQQIGNSDSAHGQFYSIDSTFTPSDRNCEPTEDGQRLGSSSAGEVNRTPRSGRHYRARAAAQRVGAPNSGRDMGIMSSDSAATVRGLTCDQARDALARQVAGQENLRDLLHAPMYLHPVVVGVRAFDQSFCAFLRACGLTTTGAAPPSRSLAPNESPTPLQEEGVTSAVLIGLNSIVIPALFGLLGTMVGVLRSVTSKMRDNVLAPRDQKIAWIAIFLGLAAGLTVGLFFSPMDGAASKGQQGTIAVSAASLSFLAGLGAEAFFTFLDGVIARLLPSTGDGRGSAGVPS